MCCVFFFIHKPRDTEHYCKLAGQVEVFVSNRICSWQSFSFVLLLQGIDLQRDPQAEDIVIDVARAACVSHTCQRFLCCICGRCLQVLSQPPSTSPGPLIGPQRQVGLSGFEEPVMKWSCQGPVIKNWLMDLIRFTPV